MRAQPVGAARVPVAHVRNLSAPGAGARRERGGRVRGRLRGGVDLLCGILLLIGLHVLGGGRAGEEFLYVLLTFKLQKKHLSFHPPRAPVFDLHHEAEILQVH